jgi:AcrR family transcriptional regulator
MTELQDGRVQRQQSIYDLNKLKLIDTAIELINEIGDIKEVTLTQIAKEAGVSPATAYNHFPDRMSDLFASIVKSKLDVRETFMESMLDKSKSLLDTIKEVPVIYAKKIIEIGYTGKVIISQMGNLTSQNKWLDDDPVQVVKTLLEQEGTYKEQSVEIAEKITTSFRGALFEYSLNREKLNNQYSPYTSKKFVSTCETIVEDVLKQY